MEEVIIFSPNFQLQTHPPNDQLQYYIFSTFFSYIYILFLATLGQCNRWWTFTGCSIHLKSCLCSLDEDGLNQLLREISGCLAAKWWWAGTVQWVLEAFLLLNSCLLWLKMRLIRAVRLNQNTELKDTKTRFRVKVTPFTLQEVNWNWC